MRFCSVIALVAGVAVHALGHQAPAAEQFPYTAYVTSDDVYVRSGPGKNYYPTEKLTKGEAVEIYRHDPGGWYAIRPPQGSFSWVPASALRPTKDGLAIVEKDRTACFVGTRFSNARDVNQLRLDQGEEVEILDVREGEETDSKEQWYQIAPPSGEFRWVFGKFVEREKPSGLSSAAEDALRAKGESISEIDEGEGWKEKQGSESGAAPREPRRPNWRATKGSRTTEKEPEITSAASADPFQAELNEIDLALSKIVSEEPKTWEFTALKRRTEAVLGRSTTALERGRVRLILNRISRFEDVKRREEMISQSGTVAARPPVLPVEGPDRFDSMGKLTPVVAQRPNAPRYALLDETNHVISFITPAPGMNLQPYVGRQVGVSGQRGFMPELKKPHVTAQRVNVLESTTVR